MENEELIKHLKDIDDHLSVLRGRQMTNTLVLEFLLQNSPEALSVLASLDSDKLEGLLLPHQMTDLAIHSALDQLALFRGHLQAC
jgi:hypothetical protein